MPDIILLYVNDLILSSIYLKQMVSLSTFHQGEDRVMDMEETRNSPGNGGASVWSRPVRSQGHALLQCVL